MNALVILLLVSVFSTQYLAQQLRVLPTYWILIPELLSAVALLVVLARVIAGRGGVALDWRYIVFLALFSFVLVFGFLAQSVPAGAIVAGLRNYVKFVPFFLLPLAYRFTSRQLKAQLAVLLTILVIQSPLAVYQRFVQFANRMHTGDPIRGMATSSSALSMLMLCGITLLVALYLHRRIRLPLLLLGVAVLFLPTTLNETKGTVVLLPIALLAPALFMPARARPMRRLVPVAAIGSIALFSFVVVYDYLVQYRETGQQIGTFFSEGHVESYLYSGAAEGEDRYVGRFDSVLIAAKMLSDDPLKLAFGLGAGNVSVSFLPGFEGRYASYFEPYGVSVTQVSNFAWEIGFVGLAAYLLLYWFVFKDARLLAKTGGSFAICGQVWATVMIIMTAALMYKSVMGMNEIAYPFWFYSGVVAREAFAERRARRRRRLASNAEPLAGRRPDTGTRKLGLQWN